MSKSKLDWTAEDVDKAFLDAARGDEGTEGNTTKPPRPNFLEMLRTGGQLGKLNTGKEEWTDLL